ESFNKITFSLGGRSSRYFSKPGYNINIKGGKKLFGRSQFKLRSDSTEPTYLRSKLTSDIQQRLGLKAIAANYATLYINEEYMGIFILMDKFKPSWIEEEYHEKDTPYLYKCDGKLNNESESICTNENEDIVDNTEFNEFIKSLNTAQSIDEINQFFEVEHFIKEMAIEYLIGSWDNFQNQNNFYYYKQPNGKWIYLSHDFDNTFGSNIDRIFVEYIPDDHGKYPGRINELANDHYPYSYWNDNIEFTSVKTVTYFAYGIKYWILAKYRFVCKEYHLICDATFLNENYLYPVNKEIEFLGYDNDIKNDQPTNILFNTAKSSNNPITAETEKTKTNDTVISSSTTTLPSTTNTIKTVPSVNIKSVPPLKVSKSKKNKCLAELVGYPCCSKEITTIYDHDEYGDWSYDFSEKQWCGITPLDESLLTSNVESCWSEVLGYPCCLRCKVYETDSNGSWGYESNHWCGIPKYCNQYNNNNNNNSNNSNNNNNNNNI
ncbi:Non-catalytic module family DOC2, partial [Piromyces sp. E2]